MNAPKVLQRPHINFRKFAKTHAHVGRRLLSILGALIVIGVAWHNQVPALALLMVVLLALSLLTDGPNILHCVREWNLLHSGYPVMAEIHGRYEKDQEMDLYNITYRDKSGAVHKGVFLNGAPQPLQAGIRVMIIVDHGNPQRFTEVSGQYIPHKGINPA